ncbi:MAG: alkaline shock response membrane anchor protein AmaP [Actinomycetia bacterium]|nr:alkaline shock response membrane anchor protein AmaP [Actinomycetes bacterium]
MNIFNKVIVVLVLICLALFCLLSIANEFANFLKWSDTVSRLLNPDYNINPYIATLALLFIFIICIFLLILEFYPKRTRAASISSSKSGYAMITIGTIAAQIKASLSKLEGLENTKVEIVPKSGGIIVNILASLNEDQNIPDKMQEIVREAAGIASEKLGIKVTKTNLTIVGITPKKIAEDKLEMVEEAGKDIVPDEVKTENSTDFEDSEE